MEIRNRRVPVCKVRNFAWVAGFACLLELTPLARASDVSEQLRAFHACAICHSVTEGQQRTGPSLFAVIGRRAGSASGYDRYSKALIGSNITWSAELLDRWIENPRSLVPRTRMLFSGLSDPHERRLVVQYLMTLQP